MDGKIKDTVETLKGYMTENGDASLADRISVNSLTKDVKMRDEVTDAVIAMICKIGVDENYQPNIHGVILDGCLEVLNAVRSEYHS